MNDRESGSERDRGHRSVTVAASVVALTLVVGAAVAVPGGDGLSLGLDGIGLSDIESSPETSAQSTVVEIPAPITLRPPTDGRIGIRLRLSVFFSWNRVRFIDIGSEDIATSLRTLTVVPGIELMVPVGEHWMVRPYGQLGGLSSLGLSGHRWMASLGARAGARWPFDRWILSAGGRFDYTAVFDEDWSRTDGVAFVDLGGDFSFPLWFDVSGERAAAGFFVMTRGYADPADLVGQDGFDLDIGAHIEIGASFQIGSNPKIWFVKLPRWYGLGARFAKGHRSLRVYLGFPF